MNTPNLFKSIKNISYLTAFACLPLSSAYGETTPQEIIEAYAKDKTLLGTESLAGNVLTYKNIEGKTIVLKSGNDFVSQKKEEEKDVRVVSLEEIFKYTTGSDDASSKDSNSAISSFGDYCKKDNSAWYTYISSKHPYDTAFSPKNPTEYIQTNRAQTLHGRLGNFRHTEIQVQALWKKYNDIPQYDPDTIKKLQKKSKDIEKKLKLTGMLDTATAERYKNYRTKELIKTLLPRVLLETMNENDPNQKIYSLFEACNACEKTNWLQNKKGIFMFALLDGQFTKNGKYKVKDKEAKKPEEEKVVFMSQKNLEDKKIKDASDLKEDFTKL